MQSCMHALTLIRLPKAALGLVRRPEEYPCHSCQIFRGRRLLERLGALDLPRFVNQAAIFCCETGLACALSRCTNQSSVELWQGFSGKQKSAPKLLPPLSFNDPTIR